MTEGQDANGCEGSSCSSILLVQTAQKDLKCVRRGLLGGLAGSVTGTVADPEFPVSRLGTWKICGQEVDSGRAWL